MKALSALEAQQSHWNLRFADDIDGFAWEEEELVKCVERLDKPFYRVRQGGQCPDDQADDKQYQWQQHNDQSEWIEAWDCHKFKITGISYTWRGFLA